MPAQQSQLGTATSEVKEFLELNWHAASEEAREDGGWHRRQKLGEEASVLGAQGGWVLMLFGRAD